jgi:hypothetical protein
MPDMLLDGEDPRRIHSACGRRMGRLDRLSRTLNNHPVTFDGAFVFSIVPVNYRLNITVFVTVENSSLLSIRGSSAPWRNTWVVYRTVFAVLRTAPVIRLALASLRRLRTTFPGAFL